MKDPFAPWVSTKHPGVRKGTHRETGAVKWKVFYRPVGAVNQTSRTFDTLDAARRFRTEHEQELERARDGRARLAPKRTMPLRTFVEQRFLPRYSGATRSMYAGCFAAAERGDPEFMAMPIGLIRGADIEIMLARLDGLYAPSTINKVRASVGAALNRAADDGHIERLSARIPKRRVQRPQAPPSPAELGLVIQALPARRQAPVLVAAAAGLRSGELRALAPADIAGLEHNLRDGWHRGPGPYAITVRRQLDRMGRELSLPKSSASQRTIAVIGEVVDTIASHLNRFGVGQVQGVTLLWPSGSETLRKAVARASARTLGREVKVHTLRRFYGTQLVYSGVPIQDIQADLGHADPSVTMSWYLSALEGREVSPAKRAAVAPLFDAAAALPLRR